MNMRKYNFTFLLFFIALHFSVDVKSAEADKRLRILFVGNSFTYGIEPTFNALLEATESNAYVKYFAIGGANLGQHAKDQTLRKLIGEGNWDYVVLQEHGLKPFYADTRKDFYEASRALDKIVTESGAKTAFYVTWARRDGVKNREGNHFDYFATQKRVTESYAKIAGELKSIQLKAGPAWEALRRGNSSLGEALHHEDKIHSSAKGSYLASLVIYCSLFNKSPYNVNYKGDLSDSELEMIKRAVAETINE